jgi:hypothetical protein
MSALSDNNPTLLDLATRLDPTRKIASIAEILNQSHEILDYMTFTEGNTETGMRTSIRTGLPAPTWRKLYGGVQPEKSTTVQISENCGSLEAYSEIDKDLVEMAGDKAAFLLSESLPHIEGMANELCSTLFTGNELTEQIGRAHV